MGARNLPLKKIPVADLRMGMHVHALEGDWMAHSFWKTRFLLRDAADMRKLRDCGVREVWIDTSRGIDVRVPETGVSLKPGEAVVPGGRSGQAGAPSGLAAASPVPSTPPPPPERTSMREELQRAAALCYRSREAVNSMFNEARLGHALDAERCMPLVNDITQSVLRNPGALVSLARLKTADDYSYMHSVAVCALMVALGRQMGLDEEACREAGLAGLLHDLGKAAVPLDILNKPGKLTDAEFAVIREHPQRGWEMLQEAQGASAAAMDVCLHHHERTDGRGYPHKLSGDKLSTLARMGAVCDVYDAITSNRPYKAGWDPAESIARMASWQGQFDDAVFRSFVRSLGIYPNGALVRLASGRLAVVMAQNPQVMTSPLVKAFYDTTTEMPISPRLLDLARDTSERIVDREPPGRWNFPHLDAMWAGEDVIARSK